VGGPDPRLSKVISAHALIVAGLSFTHSLRVRGLRLTLLFAALGSAIPILGELVAINVLKLLRHHVRPQVAGVPLAVALGWYNVTYGTFTMMESILDVSGTREVERSRTLAPGAALAATSLDLLLDPAGLDLGLWQWSADGSYAAEVVGPGGKRGVPLLNFAGWLGITAGVTLAYERLGPVVAVGSGEAGDPEAGRRAALLLLSYYLPAAAWAAKVRRREFLLYSAPFSVVAWMALKKERPATY
jgi:uncharacterized membrane protein